MNLPQLNPRELEVMELLAKGYLVKEIAQAQGVSFFTVDTQIKMIYRKLNVQSRSQAIILWLGRMDKHCPCCGAVLRAEPPKIQEKP